MKISATLAQNIIDGLASVLQQQLNFFDENGTIIASTSPGRIGNYHGGAAKLLREGLSQLFVHEDGEYEGALRGCNYSLDIDGKTVGAIGITGDSEEVDRYGKIIKRMTEIQLAENDAHEKKKIADRIRDRFFDDWILTEINVSEPDFVRRAGIQRVDLHVRRRVVVFQLRKLHIYRDTPDGQQLIDAINRCLRQLTGDIPDAVFSKTPSQMICLLPFMEDERLRAFIRTVFSSVEAEFGEELIAGADSLKDFGRVSMHQAYEKASRALSSCEQTLQRVLFYDEATYELLISEISVQSREDFVRRVFNACSPEEIEDFSALIFALYKNDGSIQQTAAQLYLHKNTVLYKLNRITEITGLNPRHWLNIPLFYLAILFHSGK